MSALQVDYLNLGNLVGNIERYFFLNQGAVTVEVHTHLKNTLRNSKRGKAIRNHLSIHTTLIIIINEHNSWKPNTCFRCGLEDHFIAIFPKPDTSNKKVHWNMKQPKICVYGLKKKIDKTPENSIDESESQKIYESMACLSSNI